MYDAIVGTDTLKKIYATIDFTNKTLTGKIQNELRTIRLGQIDEKSADPCKSIDIQKPAVYRVDKITSRRQCTGDKRTAG